MISAIALKLFLGMPLIAYGGLITLLLLLTTLTLGYLNLREIELIPLKWYMVLIVVTIAFATIHAFLGISVLLDF